ncbi:hypothetical protein BR93DRAFT_963243 [Coniochaeta sp. PMI_546]|nr:hypothetical protein BR93DRAFT_963243 [Coniochaeta sp. PMI_546]
MENASARTVPQIPTLRGDENLEEWKLQVIEVFKFYDMEVSPPKKPSRKREFRELELAPFLLGLLSASVAPVASRLLKAGWDFSQPDQNPVDLYHLTLRVVVPPSQLSKTVANILRQFSLATPRGYTGLRVYRSKVEGYKRHLEVLGYPIDDKLAVCVVINALEEYCPVFRQQLVDEMPTGDLTWSKLMEKIDKKAALCDERT